MLRTSILRSAAPLGRRCASTSTEGAQKAASDAATKAKAAAGPALDKAKAAAGPALAQANAVFGKASGAVGNALGSYKQPIVENAAVTKEFLKLIYQKELTPPSLAEVRYTYSNFFQHAQAGSFWLDLYASGQWKKVALYAVEAYGIFKIGEMIGRRHVVGYKLEEDRYAKLT